MRRIVSPDGLDGLLAAFAGPVADAAGQGANSIPVELRFKVLSLDAGQCQQ
jgi:hypothetical protein